MNKEELLIKVLDALQEIQLLIIELIRDIKSKL